MGGGLQPPRGWLVSGGELSPDRTVVGYMARRCEVVGRCYERECRRSVTLVYEELLKRNRGGLFVEEVRRTYRCNRLELCSLQFQENENPLRLADLAGHRNVAVEVSCIANCKAQYVTTVEAMIRRLGAWKTGGRDTDCRKVAEAIPADCPTCGLRRWRVRILWHDPAGKPPSWRLKLDDMIARAEMRRAAAPMPVEAGGVRRVEAPRKRGG